MKPNKHIIVNEKTANDVMGYLLSESFVPSYKQTLAIKEYLDKNFTKTTIDDIDENGNPRKKPAVQMVVSGQPLKTMEMPELILHLTSVDKFIKMIKNEDDLKSFMKQVVRDWFMNRIDKNGLLSVNHV